MVVRQTINGEDFLKSDAFAGNILRPAEDQIWLKCFCRYQYTLWNENFG